MTTITQSRDTAALREAILSDPGSILEDPQILRALVSAEDDSRGGNVVDLRTLAMSKLEHRLIHLEDTHQQVISAAYDNVAVTQQVHRAIHAMLVPLDFDGFLQVLDDEVRDCLRLRAIRLVMESGQPASDSLLNRLDGVLSLVSAETLGRFADQGRRSRPAPITLRATPQGHGSIYGTAAAAIRSEALVRLDLWPDRAPGLLVLGSAEPDHFVPGQATDLLELFSRVCERLVRGWLG